MTQTTQTARAYDRTSSAAEAFEPFIVDGEAVGEVHWLRTSGSDGRTLAAGLWRTQPTSFPYSFAHDETMHILEGELEVELDGGEVLKLGPGDLVSFAKGTNTTWTVKTTYDAVGRPLRDLRVSVTDRCNFRCVYCMPKEVFGPDHQFLPRAELLTFEEIARLADIFVSLGVRKVRLTGGEPLVRQGVDRLVALLAAIPGIEIALTTNGSLLAAKAAGLRHAGLARVTVSLDSLDDVAFGAINDVRFPVARVPDGIEAAAHAGLTPVKVNMVVKRGVNDACLLPMARHFRFSGHILRFIEYMDVGTTNGWRLDHVVPAAEIVDRIHEEFPLESVGPRYPGEVASRYRYLDRGGEIGVIASVTRPFCGGCTRARLSADGRLYTCLFAGAACLDLRNLLRQGTPDEQIRDVVVQAWAGRGDRYSELRTSRTPSRRRVEMSYIGG